MDGQLQQEVHPPPPPQAAGEKRSRTARRQEQSQLRASCVKLTLRQFCKKLALIDEIESIIPQLTQLSVEVGLFLNLHLDRMIQQMHPLAAIRANQITNMIRDAHCVLQRPRKVFKKDAQLDASRIAYCTMRPAAGIVSELDFQNLSAVITYMASRYQVAAMNMVSMNLTARVKSAAYLYLCSLPEQISKSGKKKIVDHYLSVLQATQERSDREGEALWGSLRPVPSAATRASIRGYLDTAVNRGLKLDTVDHNGNKTKRVAACWWHYLPWLRELQGQTKKAFTLLPMASYDPKNMTIDSTILHGLLRRIYKQDKCPEPPAMEWCLANQRQFWSEYFHLPKQRAHTG